MAAAKKPLEFHAKRPWGPEEGVEDPDEDDEGDNDETENGFSLEEVLRLGGTKVMAWDSRRRGTKAREWSRAWRVARGGTNGPTAPELWSGRAYCTQTLASKCALYASRTDFPLLFAREKFRIKCSLLWPYLECSILSFY